VIHWIALTLKKLRDWVQVTPAATGGQVPGPKSWQLKSDRSAATCTQLLARVTGKLNPYWLSFPPPLPASNWPW